MGALLLLFGLLDFVLCCDRGGTLSINQSKFQTAAPQKNKKAAANAATADSGIDQRAFIAFTSAVSASAESKHIMKYA